MNDRFKFRVWWKRKKLAISEAIYPHFHMKDAIDIVYDQGYACGYQAGWQEAMSQVNVPDTPDLKGGE